MAECCTYLVVSALMVICKDICAVREDVCKGVVVKGGGNVVVTFNPALQFLFGFTSAADSIAAKMAAYPDLAKEGNLSAFLQSLSGTGPPRAGAPTVWTFGGQFGKMLSSICGQIGPTG